MSRSVNESGRYTVDVPEPTARELLDHYPVERYPEVQSVGDALLEAASDALDGGSGVFYEEGFVVLPRSVYDEECAD